MTPAQQQRAWRHKSIRSLVRAAGGGTAEDIIRAKARECIAWAKAHGGTGPPFRPLELVSLLGIKYKSATHLFTVEAQLTPLPGRQRLLEFNPDRAEGRRNYSICHEVVHTFFDDCYEMVHQRKANRATYDPEREVEFLCQIGAAELLMPPEDFRRDLNTVDLSLRSTPMLMKRYAASREAILRRMIALAPAPAAVVFLSRRQSPVQERSSRGDPENPPPRFRICYTVRTDDFPLYLPHHKSVPDSSCVCQASGVDEVVSQQEQWDIAGFGDWLVEAMVLPSSFGAAPDM